MVCRGVVSQLAQISFSHHPTPREMTLYLLAITTDIIDGYDLRASE